MSASKKIKADCRNEDTFARVKAKCEKTDGIIISVSYVGWWLLLEGHTNEVKSVLEGEGLRLSQESGSEIVYKA